jgi:hypothetical protein
LGDFRVKFAIDSKVNLGIFYHIMGLQDRFYSIQNYPFFGQIPEGPIILY